MNSIITISPSRLGGSITAPRSKSSMQRACAAALIRKGESIIHHPGRSNDDMAALEVIRQLGAVVNDEGGRILVSSNGVRPVADEINCGESGLGVRMFTPIAALSGLPLRITGHGSLMKRPVDFFEAVLPQLGVQVTTNGGKLPLQVQGPLRPCNIEVDGSLSSQFLTGLLMAFAAAGAADAAITVNNLTSKPYIDLTLDVMRRFQLPVPENDGYKHFFFHPPVYTGVKDTVSYEVEGDWSGGAFLLVAGAIAGPLVVNGLNTAGTQADKAIITALERAGVTVAAASSGCLGVEKGAMQAFEFDATDCPDLFPPLVALAAYCSGKTLLKGVSRLTHKESNRGEALRKEFGKMGVRVILNGDWMEVQGGGALHGAAVHSHNDHRIAMACAVAALSANSPVSIEGAEAVAKSYPQFFNHLEQLGAVIQGSEFMIQDL